MDASGSSKSYRSSDCGVRTYKHHLSSLLVGLLEPVHIMVVLWFAFCLIFKREVLVGWRKLRSGSILLFLAY